MTQYEMLKWELFPGFFFILVFMISACFWMNHIEKRVKALEDKINNKP